jgi:hypothetical protein
MKLTLTAIIALFTLFAKAQAPLSPAKNAFEKKWIKDETYQMKWFALRDTIKMEIGEVTTQNSSTPNTLTIITTVNMKGSKTPWIDTTVAKAADLTPIRHTSYNQQREMVLNFGKTVTGYYHDKLKNVRTPINDTPQTPYFDSNLYPALISWLPLSENFKQDINIYDYNPSGKIGLLKASVNKVTSGVFKTTRAGNIKVWIVEVTDEISLGKTAMTYYIAQLDRKVWKQEINAGGRKMEMLRIEN